MKLGLIILVSALKRAREDQVGQPLRALGWDQSDCQYDFLESLRSSLDTGELIRESACVENALKILETENRNLELSGQKLLPISALDSIQVSFQDLIALHASKMAPEISPSTAPIGSPASTL